MNNRLKNHCTAEKPTNKPNLLFEFLYSENSIWPDLPTYSIGCNPVSERRRTTEENKQTEILFYATGLFLIVTLFLKSVTKSHINGLHFTLKTLHLSVKL